MPSIWDWSTTPANNATADAAINWAEGQAPSTVNNSARVMMERVKEFMGDLGGINTATGTGNSISITTTSPFTAYVDGLIVTFRAIADNTGATTINANAIGVKPAYRSFVNSAYPLLGGEIANGSIVEAQYVVALNGGTGGWILTRTEGKAENGGYIFGLPLSNNVSDAVNDIDIAAGAAATDSPRPVVMALSSALGKRLDANWVVGGTPGASVGGLDTGAIANGTYHVWLIQRSDTGVVDALFSLSATAPTMPASYDRKRRIGSILREAATIIPFFQDGDTFIRGAAATDRSSTAAAADALLTLSVPAGIIVKPIVILQLVNTAAAANIINGLQSALAGSAGALVQQVISSAATQVSDITTLSMFSTNTSRQIWFKCTISSGAISTNILYTIGWVDTRGRV